MKMIPTALFSALPFMLFCACSGDADKPSAPQTVLTENQKTAFIELEEYFKSSDPEERAMAYDRIAFAGNPEVYPLFGFHQNLMQDIASDDETLRNSAVNAAGYYLEDGLVFDAYDRLFQTPYAIEKTTALEEIFNQDWSERQETSVFPMLFDPDEDVCEIALNIVGDRFDSLDTLEKARAYYQKRFDALKAE